ncbi:MAG: hypothetical protein LUH15_12680 [Tannerellaceae bacterium]|nr:hypothetical protein [Tannerellaceae bacterium]
MSSIGEQIKNLVQQSGMSPEEVAASLGYYSINKFNQPSLQQICPVCNVEITYSFAKNNKNKTAVGNQSIVGNSNLSHDNLYNPEREIKQFEPAASEFSESELIKQLEKKKRELVKLQGEIIELQDSIISLKK